MNEQHFDHAKEQIRQALVHEYLQRHPNVREQDVVMACINGELVFTHFSAILEDIQIRKHYSQGLAQAKNLFAELPIHRDKRWQDCVASTRHSNRMIDCLNSSHFKYYFNKQSWSQHHQFIKDKEGKCALSTVRIFEARKQLAKRRKVLKNRQINKTRALVIDYLRWLIEQSKNLLEICKREMDLGDMFAEEARKYLQVNFPSIGKTANKADMESLLKIFRQQKFNSAMTKDQIMALNMEALVKTKNALFSKLEELKTLLEKRRDQYDTIWNQISEMQKTLNEMESKPESTTKKSRKMPRYLKKYPPKDKN